MSAMAQECFWQQAVLGPSFRRGSARPTATDPPWLVTFASSPEKYKNGIISRLAMKVSELYDEALTASAKDVPPTSAYLPPVRLIV
jgi:hypothetical protein